MLKKGKDIGNLLSAEYVKQKEINHLYHLKVLQNLIYLGHQGLPMRGNWVSIEEGASCEENSNFHQLLLLRANDDANISNIMKQKARKYTDHHIQNEILQIMALNYLCTIADDIRNSG